VPRTELRLTPESKTPRATSSRSEYSRSADNLARVTGFRTPVYTRHDDEHQDHERPRPPGVEVKLLPRRPRSGRLAIEHSCWGRRPVPERANADANNGSGRAWTAVEPATAKADAELGSGTSVDGCGQPSFDS
jgi:hypothetical protein